MSIQELECQGSGTELWSSSQAQPEIKLGQTPGHSFMTLKLAGKAGLRHSCPLCLSVLLPSTASTTSSPIPDRRNVVLKKKSNFKKIKQQNALELHSSE